MNPDTDIIITVRISSEFEQVKEDLLNCVNTLREHTHGFRPIFVDDNSEEQYQKWIEDIVKQFEYGLYIRTHHQRWFTRAVNLGLRMARTPYVAVVNCDTVYSQGWLEELYAVKDEVEANTGKVGLVGSIMSAEEPRRYMLSVGRDYVTGHCWLLSMQALYEVSAARGTPGIYLDETNPGAIHIVSDVHLCWNLNQQGWQCVKAFKSNVGHIGGRTWGQQLHRIPGSLEAVNDKYI
jgi:glycosyltransferase involved in cell wall biosynthesis